MSLFIICEYNPFHRGHLYQLREARRLFPDEKIVCVMSGNFVQRGEPAIVDKWVRTEMALSAGADLVLELPTVFAVAGAEDFARGAVGIAIASGLADKLVFSVEPGTEALLEPVARALVENSDLLGALTFEFFDTATSYAIAREEAMRALLAQTNPEITAEDLALLRSPNAILALEYLKQIYRTGAGIAPVILTRQGADYHDDTAEGDYPSATALRKLLAEGADIAPMLPEEVREVWQKALGQGFGPVFPEQLSPLLHFTLANRTAADLAEIPGVAEGLENRILSESRHFSGWNDLVTRIATKRYPTARLRRILLYEILGITKARLAETGFADGPRYIRVLGCRDTALLSALSEAATLPVLTSLNHMPELSPQAQAALADEIRYTDIYTGLLPNSLTRGLGYEYRAKLIIK